MKLRKISVDEMQRITFLLESESMNQLLPPGRVMCTRIGSEDKQRSGLAAVSLEQYEEAKALLESGQDIWVVRVVSYRKASRLGVPSGRLFGMFDHLGRKVKPTRGI